MTSIRSIRLVLAAISLVASSALARAQEPQPSPEQLKIQVEVLKDQLKIIRQQQTGFDPEIYQSYKKAKMNEYEYLSRLMELNVQALSAQSTQTFAVMFLVVIVVLSGLSFSAFQLWRAMNAAGVQTDSNIEISAKNVRVTSSIVGVIVLVISIAFLYIYVRYG